MLWAQLLTLYKTPLVKSLMIRHTMKEVTITVEAIPMVETMHRMAMVMEIIDLTVATSAAVREEVKHSLI